MDDFVESFKNKNKHAYTIKEIKFFFLKRNELIIYYKNLAEY